MQRCCSPRRRAGNCESPTTIHAEAVRRYRQLMTNSRTQMLPGGNEETGTQYVARYWGAHPLRHRCAITLSLYLTRSGTSSQWAQCDEAETVLLESWKLYCKWRLKTAHWAETFGAISFWMTSLKSRFLDDRNVELRIRVTVSMPGKNFSVWNPVFLHTAGENYRHLWRMV